MPYVNPLNPAFEITFDDLYEREGLLKLHQKFINFLEKKDSEISQKFASLKANKQNFSKAEEAEILIDVARVLEDFLAELFSITEQNLALQKDHFAYKKIYKIRRDFVQRIVAKKFDEATFLKLLKEQNISHETILENLKITYKSSGDLEIKLADAIDELLKKEENLSETEQKRLDQLTIYSACALHNKFCKALHKNGALFILPKKVDQQNLVSVKNFTEDKKERDGFNLTDQGFTLNRVLGESNYCIFCHKQNKDSCRSGAKEKNEDRFKYDALNVELHGCPLDEKISEMNFLKSEGLSIAALSIAVVDNPMIAGTGHRICNDCMKSCIYQKQDPVDIPQIETKTLRDVLALPYGFEIYSLLTRWNPLNIEREIPQENSGKRILIAGLGPAGYTLAHHLMNDGHEVVAIDGLKIEPLDAEISGINEFGIRQEFKPIKFVNEIYEPLSKRLIQGFGGVAEYGITVRWDKNFLKVIRLLLERRKNFRMFGGIRFGSSITEKIAFDTYGFDHVALCIGAGRPNIIDIKNNFAKGIRSASDFLMSLQLTGAFKKDLFTNLQIRMPILVIGAGLTAMDTACEAQAYYLLQIEKFAQRYKKLSEVFGEEEILKQFNLEEKIIAEEFLNHAREVEKYELKNFESKTDLLKKWGGVKILYRKKIQDSPAYRFNHQEVIKSFEEGVELVENISPVEAVLDQFGHIKILKTADSQGLEKLFDCKSLFIAAGTTPNLAPALEDGLDFQIRGKYFAEVDEQGNEIASSYSAKPQNYSVLTKIDKESGKSVSFFGDLHPNFEGNVVKAMASAKLGYKKISEILKPRESGADENHQFLNKVNSEFLVQIKEINQLSDYALEVVVKAPLLAKQTKLGQIFRLQNYHAFAQKVSDQTMAMEGVAITALKIDETAGLISGIIINTGGSTSLIKNFKTGEPVVFMGPSGQPTELAKNENVILVGGGRGNMPLTAIAEAYKKNGCKIIFVAGYRRNSFVLRQSEIERLSDVAIFAIEDEEPNLKLNRVGDVQFKGDVIEAMQQYFSKNSLEQNGLSAIDRIFAIGNESMMYAVSQIRYQELEKILHPKHIAISSLNAPMQCMLKGVCSQCLQKRKDEKTGKWEYFYACANQDQKTDLLDFTHLKWRCEQNSLAEKISKMWISHLSSNQTL